MTGGGRSPTCHADLLLHVWLVVQLWNGALALQLVSDLQLVDVLRHRAIWVAFHHLGAWCMPEELIGSAHCTMSRGSTNKL